MLNVTSATSSIDMQEQLATLQIAVKTLTQERDEYKRLYVSMLELCKKLEKGIVGPKRERFVSDAQLTMSLLQELLNTQEDSKTSSEAETQSGTPDGERKPKRPPTGRKPFPEKLPRVDIEVLPPEVQKKGLEAFERIGEEVTETVERRPASLVVVRIHKPKFALKGRDKLEDNQILQGQTPELPIERGMAGPSLLADTIVKRWEEHQPLHRMERSYGREGLELARSTVCRWHASLAFLAHLLIEAMWEDALKAPYLCTDATGVLVQAKNECTRGHFFVVLAPGLHVLFGYTPKHNGDAVDELLEGFKGYLVADAHSIYDHLYVSGDVLECGCWSHQRRYYCKALQSDPLRAQHALTLIGHLFRIEREQAQAPPEQRLAVRTQQSKPLVDAFFAWCDQQAPLVLDETPISKAIAYSRNHRTAFERFLQDGRLPIHNNWSENALRREAVSRKNWLFLGNDDAGDVNATFVTLLASCQMHGLEPHAYLRDLFCLLPGWPQNRVLELAPAYWRKTIEDPETQQRLAANVFRQISLETFVEHSVSM